MSDLAYIYCLLDPDNGKCRYVGKSIDPVKRLKIHLIYEEKNPYKYRWIQKVLKNEKYPVLKILESVDNQNWQERERWWISFFRKKRQPLTNLTLGGEGSNGVPCSKEKKKKISRSLMGHQVSRKTREKQSKVAKERLKNPKNHPMFGKKMTLEQRQRLSESHTGYEMPKSQREKISKSLKGKHPFIRSDISFDLVKSVAEDNEFNMRKISKILSVSRSVMSRLIKENGFANWKEFSEG